MDHYSIIDRETFKVYTHEEDCPYAFVCDKPIAPAIAELNKKGYKTFASCSGHYEITFWEYRDEDIKDLEELKKDDKVIIRKIDDKTFDYWVERDLTCTYILFSQHYEFESLPEGFKFGKMNENDNRTEIHCDINYYNEKNERKTMKEVLEEIDEKCKLLKKWVDNLPEIEKGND